MRAASAAVALRRLRPGRPLRLPRLSPRLRLALLVLATVALVLAAVFRFWLRDSDMVAVERVAISGSRIWPTPGHRAARSSPRLAP